MGSKGRHRNGRTPRPSGLVLPNGKPAGPVQFDDLPLQGKVMVLAVAVNSQGEQLKRQSTLIVEIAEALASDGWVKDGSNLDSLIHALDEKRREVAELKDAAEVVIPKSATPGGSENPMEAAAEEGAT